MPNNECYQDQPSVHILPNGLQVVIQQDTRFPLVAMRLYIHAGSAFEHQDEAGLSHLLEHMAFKGSGNRAAGQAAEEAERVGGSVNAATGFDHTMFMLDLPAAEWGLGLEILNDLCFDIQIDDQELELEKQVVLAELERNRDDPKRCLFERMQAALWQGTGYEVPVIGRRESVESLSSQRIHDYLQRLYQPQAMVLVICGDVEPAQVLERVSSLFGVRTNTDAWAKAVSLDVDCLQTGSPRVDVQATHWSKVYLAAGIPVPALASPWATALEVLTYLLCGDRTSRWYKKFKYDLELVDDISVAPILLERSGILYIKAQLDAEQVEPFWQAFLHELQELDADLFSADEIGRAKLNIEDGLLQTRETLSGVAAKLGFFQFFEGDLRAEERYLHHLRHLTGQELSAAVQEFLRPERMQVCLLAPQEAGIEADRLEQAFRSVFPDQEAVASSRARRQRSDAVEVHEVGNGCSLVLIPDRTLPYTSVDLSWLGGDLLLDGSEQGLASLTARSLARGTETKDNHQVQEYLAERAASMEAFASRDQFSVTAKFPSKFSPDVLSLFQEVLSSPAFGSEEIDKARQDQASIIVERSEHPLGLISREVFPFLFSGQSYGHYHLGLPEGLASFQRQRLQDFWARQSGQPWVMSVCGSFDPDEMRQTAQALTKLSRFEPLPLPQELGWTEERELKLVLADRRQVHLLLIFPIPGLGHSSNAGMMLLKNLLAGQGGLLFREMREKQGLGYAVTPMLWRTKPAGFLAFYIGTEPDKAATALDSFHALTEQLRSNAIDPEEVRRAQQLLQTEYFRDRQSLASRSSEAADLLTYGFDLNFHKSMIDEALGLSAADLSSLAAQYLDLSSAYTITVSPSQED